MRAGAACWAAAAGDGGAGEHIGALLSGGVHGEAAGDTLNVCGGNTDHGGRPPPALCHVLHDAGCGTPFLSTSLSLVFTPSLGAQYINGSLLVGPCLAP